MAPQRAVDYYTRQAAAMHRAGLVEAAQRYEALASDASSALKPACRCCGAPLEAAESIARGTGPVCASK